MMIAACSFFKEVLCSVKLDGIKKIPRPVICRAWPDQRFHVVQITLERRFPVAVSRYSVLGSLFSKVLVQLMYCASSSFRACTLRLPSVVCSSFFSSLKVSVVVHRQRAQNAQPEALVDQPVEFGAPPDHLRGSGLFVAKFLRRCFV